MKRLGVLLLCVVLAGAGAPARVTRGLVLSGVTIVSTRDGSLQRDMAIIIDGATIENILPAGEVTVSGTARRVYAPGKFVVPGYLDMHAHALQSDQVSNTLALMLANGITGFRQMAGSPELLEARRQGKLPMDALSPALLAMPGTIMTHVNAGTPAAAIAEVDRQKAAGADFIKVIETNPATFFPIGTEATRIGLPFLGHLPETVNVRDAVQAGMRSIEHLGPNSSVLLGCSANETALRDSIAHKPPAQPPMTTGNPADLIVRVTTNPIAYSDPFEFTVMQEVLDSYSEAKCKDLAAIFVANKAWGVPTLIRVRAMEIGDDPQFSQDPNLRYIAPAQRKIWQEVGQTFTAQVSPAAKATLKQFFELQLKLTKLLDDNGVRLMAGTDSGGSAGWCPPGFALHSEFDLLDRAHVPPLHVLQMTTLNGAQFLGRETTMGTVEGGKEANLVLLDANPVLSVQNLHKIAAVVRAGTFYSRAELDAIEQRIADQYSAAK